jgi:hypothetical protein
VWVVEYYRNTVWRAWWHEWFDTKEDAEQLVPKEFKKTTRIVRYVPEEAKP